MASEEWVDLVDEEDSVIGRVTRKQMRAQNLWHRTIGVMCLDSRGRIYVHRRTDHKDVYPGLYDMFVGGVVSAGESYDETALREIGEELGIVGPTANVSVQASLRGRLLAQPHRGLPRDLGRTDSSPGRGDRLGILLRSPGNHRQ